MKYNKVFLTPGPSFYKTNLFNEICKHISICVIYTGAAVYERNADFYKGELQFDHIFLPKGLWNQIKIMNHFLRANEFDELIFGGWDNIITWILCFISKKDKNSSIFESSINESSITGFTGFIKRIFVSRLHKTYPSGKLQAELVRELGFRGTLIEYGGCGILNYQSQPKYVPRDEVKNFIYVGRLIEVKNLKMLISVFNDLPILCLTIVGFGPLENELKMMAKENITFTGAIDNVLLPNYYRNADVFILPSKSEPWGLVVEEALNNGTPVIVSNRVGCHADLVNRTTGLVFNYNDFNSLKSSIIKICDIEFYNGLRKGVSKLDFQERATRQINSFIML